MILFVHIVQVGWRKLPIYDKKDFLAVLEDSSYYLGKHCRYCGQALDLSPVEKFKEDLRTMNKTMNKTMNEWKRYP